MSVRNRPLVHNVLLALGVLLIPGLFETPVSLAGIMGCHLAEQEQQVYIRSVIAGSPADHAEMFQSLQLTHLDDQPIASLKQLTDRLAPLAAGTKVKIRGLDQGVPHEFVVMLAANNATFQAPQPSEAAAEALAELRDIMAETKTDYRRASSPIVEVTLRTSNIESRSLEIISGLKTIQTIAILVENRDRAPESSRAYTDQSFAALNALPRLRTIEFTSETRRETLCSLNTIEALAASPSLEEVIFANGELEQGTLAALAKLPHLKSLMLINVMCHNTEFRDLPALGSLTRLFVGGVKLPSTFLDSLQTLRNLEELHLPGLPLEDSHLQHVTKLTNLRILDLQNTYVTKAGLPALKPLVHLETVTLDHAGLPLEKPRDNRDADPFSVLTATRYVMTPQGGGVQPRQPGAFTMATLQDFAASLPKLKKLSAHGHRFEASQIRDFRKAFPKVELAIDRNVGR